MKCHYEVLQVDREVSDTDLRKAYRRLALKYHPDKNPDNVEECTKLFNAIQQAYEVLSDPQERAWYDKHREEILHGAGSEFKDDSLNIMPFFSASCFSGFEDNSKGFYKVYGAVFCRIADEEEEYNMEEDGERLPQFGLSTTPYEEVHTFYSYWLSFFTARSFAWEDTHDLRQAPNRRVQRMMEKENKKTRSAAKKKRNETVRQLVAFVRKRDKRVHQYREALEEKERERKKRSEERRARENERRIRERQEARERYRAQKWEESLEQDLLSVEARLDAEYGCHDDGEGDGGFEEDSLFCPACNKLFKSEKAFANHEKSRKHKENVALLKQLLEEEEREMRASSQQQTTSGKQQTMMSSQQELSDGKQQTMTSSDKESTDGEQQTGNHLTDERSCSSVESEGVMGEGETGEGVMGEGETGEGVMGEGETGMVGEGVMGEGETSVGGEDVESEGVMGCSVIDGVIHELEVHRLTGSDSNNTELATHFSSRRGGNIEDHLPTAETTPTALEATPTALEATPTALEATPTSGENPRPDSSDDAKQKKKKTRRKGKAKETQPATTASKSHTQQATAEYDSLKCSVCSTTFNSRNKLFRHIEATGHAVLLLTPSLPTPSHSSSSQHKPRRKRTGKK